MPVKISDEYKKKIEDYLKAENSSANIVIEILEIKVRERTLLEKVFNMPYRPTPITKIRISIDHDHSHLLDMGIFYVESGSTIELSSIPVDFAKMVSVV